MKNKYLLSYFLAKVLNFNLDYLDVSKHTVENIIIFLYNYLFIFISIAKVILGA